MDPLSIAASSFSIAGAIAKASVAILEFSRDARDATDDLSRVNDELQALSSVLDPLARALSRAPAVPERLAAQLQSTLEGCSLVVGQIGELVVKYQRQGGWSKAKWVMSGKGDVDKLRESLEAYKMVLSLGLHLVSKALHEDIKQDTGVIRDDTQFVRQHTSKIKITTDEILPRVNSIRNGQVDTSATRVEQWMDQMDVLSSYAETTYQGTVVNPGEWSAGEPTKAADVPESREGLEGWQVVDDDLTTLCQDQNDTPGLPKLQDKGRSPPSGEASTPPLRQGTENPQKQLPRDVELDVVVAIDIGKLSTAVSWVARNVEGGDIDQWPGGTGPRVPTVVVYSPEGDLSSWGYLCQNDTCPGTELSAGYNVPLVETLELSGDPPGSAPLSQPEVAQLRHHMTDFLRELLRHIEATIRSKGGTRMGAWGEMAIEFHFTLPDRMQMADPAAVERATNAFKDILRNAGFCNGERHLAVLGSSETEAVAVAVISQEQQGAAPSFYVKIGESNIAVVEQNTRYLPLQVTLTTSLTTKLDDALVAQIRARARDYREVVVVETSDMARRAFSDQFVKALGSPGGPPMRFDADWARLGNGFSSAGPRGLLLRRNAWGSTDGRPQLRFGGANLPVMLTRLRNPSDILHASGAWEKSLLPPYGDWYDGASFIVETPQHQKPRRTALQFDVGFTFNPSGSGVVADKGNPLFGGDTKTMCSVRSWVDAGDFHAEKVGQGWYSSRTIYYVSVLLQLFMVDQNKAGPQVTLTVRGNGGRRVAKETEVVWYCEPPHIVWGRGYIPGGRMETSPGEG